jgi:hypothetical protein
VPANRSGGRSLTTHLRPEPQLDRRIRARIGQLENGDAELPKGDDQQGEPSKPINRYWYAFRRRTWRRDVPNGR